MSTGNVHQGDVGTEYKLKVRDRGIPFDFTAATITKLIFDRPSGRLEVVASVVVDAPDWLLYYIVADDTFHAEAGNYQWQGYVEFSDGKNFHTDVESYTVFRNL